MTDEAKPPPVSTEPIPPLTAVGFCSKCGIVREDYKGIPITDCVCTAKRKHKETCMYVKAVSMWISIVSCEVHGRDACEECDCTCGAYSAPERQAKAGP